MATREQQIASIKKQADALQKQLDAGIADGSIKSGKKTTKKTKNGSSGGSGGLKLKSSFKNTSGQRVNVYSDGSKTYNGKNASFVPTSARGDEFAPAFEKDNPGFFDIPTDAGKGGMLPGETKEQAKKRIESAPFNFAGGGGTVMTNANKIERVIPLLDSQANSLSPLNLSGGGSNTNFADTSDDSSGFGEEDQNFDDILGLTDGKKKKKKQKRKKW